MAEQTPLDLKKELLNEVNKRIQELAKIKVRGDTALERNSKRDKLRRTLIRLQYERTQLELDIATIEVEETQPLDATRKAAFLAAFSQVQQAIAADKEFSAALEAARVVTRAAADALDALD